MDYRAFTTHSGLLFQDLIKALTGSDAARPNSPDLKNGHFRIEAKCTQMGNCVSVDMLQFDKYRNINDRRKLYYAIGFYYLDGAEIKDIESEDDMNRYEHFDSINFLNEDVVAARWNKDAKKFIAISQRYADDLMSEAICEKKYPKLNHIRLAKYHGIITIPRIGGTNKVKLNIYGDARTDVELLADTVKKNAKRLNARGLTSQSKLKEWI